MKTVTNISVTSAPHRGRQGWHPGLLFRSGSQGAWFDPSDTATLFQDIAASVPVLADGDPVALMQDKSGNGHNAVQSTTAARPIYRTDGQQHWLEFDGVDDFMSLEVPLDINHGTVVLGLNEPAGMTNNSGLISASGAGYIAITGSGGQRALGKNNSGVIERVDTPSLFPMTSKTAVGIRVQNGTIHARRWPDATEHFNAVDAKANLGSTSTLMAFSSGGALPARVDLYGMVLFSDALSENDHARTLIWMNKRIAL